MTDDILKSLVSRLETVFMTTVEPVGGVYTLSLPQDEIVLYVDGNDVVMEVIEIGDDDLIVDEFRIYPSDHSHRNTKEREFQGLMETTKTLALA